MLVGDRANDQRRYHPIPMLKQGPLRDSTSVSAAQILETPVTCAAGALDQVPFEPGERHERNSAAAIDVRARDADRTVGRLLLGDLERILRAGRADRNHHDAVRLHLLQKWWRDMIDRAGDDDP